MNQKESIRLYLKAYVTSEPGWRGVVQGRAPCADRPAVEGVGRVHPNDRALFATIDAVLPGYGPAPSGRSRNSWSSS